MKATILNKNIIDSTDYSTAESFEVDEGAVITLCKNETLDSGTIRISNLDKHLEIEPFDVIVLSDFMLDSRKMLVDTFTETITCLNPKRYSYEISLFSLTKELENYFCPDLKITKILNRALTRDVLFYLRTYLNAFGPNIRVVNGNSYTWTQKFTLSSAVESRFAGLECPEMQWNQPTLRSLLNDLMMVDDCIVFINQNNQIDCMDLTEIKTPTTKALAGINYITQTQSSEDYVSEIKVNMQNVTNPQDVDTVVTRAEYFPIMSDNAIISSDNWFVRTQYPIYKLKSLKLAFYAMFQDVGENTTYRKWITVDLTNVGLADPDLVPVSVTKNLVYEYKEWITKRTFYKKIYGTQTSVSVADWTEYQNYCLYYNRGGTEILNFTNQAEKYAFDRTKLLINLIKERAVDYIVNQDANIATGVPDTQNYLNMFSVEYETLQGFVFRASKDEKPGHYREVIDNQTNSYVESYNQGFLEYQKANRLGNLQKHINSRYYDNDVLKLSDMVDDSVVYQIQYQIYKNHIETNALATKNYVLRNYFTGIKAKLRSWKIADGADALTRHELIKYYFEFSYTDKTEEHGIDPFIQNHNVASYLLSPLKSDTNIAPIRYVAVRTQMGSAKYPNNNDWYLNDLITRLTGKSLVFTFGFRDNYYVEKAFDSEVNNEDNVSSLQLNEIEGGVPTTYCRYVDDNGEFGGGEFHLLNGVDSKIPEDTEASVSSDSVNFLLTTIKRPVVIENDIEDYVVADVAFSFWKDSQEIIYISNQWELGSDTTDICFTKQFLLNQEAIRTSITHNFVFYISYKYDFRNPDILPDDATTISALQLTIIPITGNKARLDIETILSYPTAALARQAINTALYKQSFYIVDNDKVLFACNNPKYHATTKVVSAQYKGVVSIYLNCLRDRDTSIYESQQNQIFKKSI